jgi:hypothetical protein
MVGVCVCVCVCVLFQALSVLPFAVREHNVVAETGKPVHRGSDSCPHNI